MKAADRLGSMLDVLKSRHRLRTLVPARGLDFASNDYLGLSTAPVLRAAARDALDRGVPLGAGGSRLLRGNHEEHEALEREAATFFGGEAALFMGGGFQANHAIFSTLPAAGDLVLYDDLIHASAHEGMRAGRAETRGFAHNDVGAARRSAEAWRAEGGEGAIWIAAESVYSMEGDLAPLDDLADLARTLDGVLVVDEAHATGVFGANGRGLAHDLDCELLTLHTCGKGLGVSGALVCGPRVMIETLVNRGRPFVFATAPSPFDAALVRAVLKHLQAEPKLSEAARDRIDHAHRAARRACIPNAALNSQIIPVILGADARTMTAAARLQDLGFDVRGIRPPTVPRGTARLRISITGHVGRADVDALFEAIAEDVRRAA